MRFDPGRGDFPNIVVILPRVNRYKSFGPIQYFGPLARLNFLAGMTHSPSTVETFKPCFRVLVTRQPFSAIEISFRISSSSW